MKKHQQHISENGVTALPAEVHEAIHPEQVLGVRFYVGGYFGGEDRIEAIRTHKGIKFVVLPAWRTRRIAVFREMSEREWRHLLQQLLDELRICDWKREYCDWRILDGEQWSLELYLVNNQSLCIIGSNDYPPEWDKLLGLFNPFLRECCISDDTDEANYLRFKEAYQELVSLRQEIAPRE